MYDWVLIIGVGILGTGIGMSVGFSIGKRVGTALGFSFAWHHMYGELIRLAGVDSSKTMNPPAKIIKLFKELEKEL